MKPTVAFLKWVLLVSLCASARADVYVSTLDQAPIGSLNIGSDYWVGTSFITGTNPGGYVLDSVQLQMNSLMGTPGDFSVSIYNQAGPPVFGPGTNLANLGGVNPSAAGLYSYSGTDVSLLPSTPYFVVATSDALLTEGYYLGSTGFGNSERSDDGWIINLGFFSSADGQNWQYARQSTFRMAVAATAVPEPSTFVLIGLGGLWLGARFRKRRSGGG